MTDFGRAADLPVQARYRATPAGALLSLDGLDLPAPDRWEGLVFAPDRPAAAAAWAAPLQPGERRRLEHRLDLGERLLWVVDHARHADGARRGVLVDHSDARRRAARDERQHLCAALARLAGGLAHEVNNPLSGVLNYLQLAERLAPEGDPRLREALAGALSEGRRVLALTRTLAQVAARGEGGGAHALPVHDLARACVAFVRRELREAFVAIEVEVPEQLPPVKGLGTALPLAVMAGLENALDALRERFPAPAPGKRVSLRAAVDGDDVLLEVEDGGGGAPPEVLARAFEPFYGTRPARLGLGLTMAREALRELGGEATLASRADGALLTLRLPIA